MIDGKRIEMYDDICHLVPHWERIGHSRRDDCSCVR